jgi:outer membrane protein OmpA-like peptidoglycan-associated protein
MPRRSSDAITPDRRRRSMKLAGPSLWFCSAALSFTLATLRAAPAAAQAPAPPRAPAAAESSPEDDATIATSATAAIPAGATQEIGLLPSLVGPIGLYHMSTGEVGPRHHLRLALHGQYFASSGLLVPGDRDTQLAGALTAGFTLHENVELFGGFFTASNRNTRTDPTRTDPDVIREHGDLVLGSKAILPVGARGATTLGLELGLRFLSSASGLAFAASSTSLWVGPLATLDLRRLAGVPLRFHGNASFYADNSKNVYDFTGTTVATRDVAAFAYGIGASRVRLAAGADLPFSDLAVPLQPFAEYHAEIVTASANTAALMPGAADGSRARQWLTFGLRAGIYKGATVDAGADVRLQSNGPAYGAPLPPYDVVFGLSYPLDVDAFTRPVVVTRTVEKLVQPPPPTEGRVAGVAKDKDGKAIAGAVVTVAGRAHGAVVTDADGTFETPALPPGPARLEISAADFEPEKVTAAVVAGQRADVTVSLTAKVKTGVVRGKISDGQGRGIEATLKFNGAQAFEARSDSSGFYSAALVAGPYQVKADALGLPTKEGQLELAPGESHQLDLTLRPLSPDLTLVADELVLRTPIRFRAGTPPRLQPQWQAELDGVAMALEDHPEFRTLRIEAHWDSGAGDKVKALTESQAAAVQEYLVKKGVAVSRLRAVGMGGDQPLVPNVSAVYKAKNRRVELHIERQ